MSVSALALDRDPSSRYVPWILAALSLVVTVSVGVSLTLAALTASWSEIGADRLSVRMAGHGPEAASRATRIAGDLERTDGVEAVRRLPPTEVALLLQPWLGGLSAEVIAELPLPEIIDVRLSDPAAARRIETMFRQQDGIAVDSMQGWLAPLRQVASLSGVVAGALALLSIGVIVLVTIFATRSSMTSHARTVELLRLMGAEESFIARRLQRHSLRQAFLGSVAGMLPGLAVVALGVGAARLDGAGLLTGLTPTIAGWTIMALLPVLIALVAMLTARYTVLKLLRHRW